MKRFLPGLRGGDGDLPVLARPSFVLRVTLTGGGGRQPPRCTLKLPHTPAGCRFVCILFLHHLQRLIQQSRNAEFRTHLFPWAMKATWHSEASMSASIVILALGLHTVLERPPSSVWRRVRQSSREVSHLTCVCFHCVNCCFPPTADKSWIELPLRCYFNGVGE